jgi:hypothetical protein
LYFIKERFKDLKIQGFKDSIPHVRDKDSKIQRFKDSRIQGFKDSKIQRFKDSRIQRFKDSKIQRFKDSRIQGFPAKVGGTPLRYAKIQES